MSKNFKRPFISSRNRQSQVQQNGNHATSRMPPSNGASQFRVPATPLLNGHSQTQQNGHYLTPESHSVNGASQFKVPLIPRLDEQLGQGNHHPPNGVHPSNGASQFRVPTTPPVGVPATSFPDVPTTPLPGIQPAIVDPRIREDVERYAQWLHLNNNLLVSPQKLQTYQDAALEIKRVGKREVRTFAPFQENTSALQVVTSGQITFLAILAVLWIVGLFILHLAMVTIALGIVTLLYICGFVTSGILATRSFRSSSGEKIDEELIAALDQLGVEWPSYTILCPLYKETAIVPQFVEAMKALDYPMQKLQVLFLTEENDSETRAVLYSMHLPPSFTILTVPKGAPQTKPRACNFGLLQAKGQFIVIFDAEDKPELYQLKKAVLTFANHGSEVACVQAKLNYYNSKQNLLTCWFTAEYSTWFDIMLPGLQRAGFALPLGGTSNHFRTEVLRALGGWDAFNVTEDCDLGLRIAQYNLKTAVLDSTTYEEATSRFKVWLFQRSRWIKGYLQTYLVHMRHPVETLRQGHLRKFFSLQLIVGAWTVVLLINPFMWVLTLVYMLFRPVQLFSILFPGPILYMGAFCLIFGNFFYVYIQLIGCIRRQEYSLIKWVLLLPLYWLMMSASAYIAFYQLIVKPHYWEKTQHGTHLAPSTRAQARTLSPVLEPERRAVAASMPTMHIFAVTVGRAFKRVAPSNTLETTTQRVTALRSTLYTQLGQHKVRRQVHLPRIRDRWLLTTLVIAIIASIGSTIYVFQHHLTLIYGDAVSHMLFGRAIFDSATPGFAQLGGVWLPLPHLLIALFAWNDYLWTTGLGGSIVSMGCYLGTTVYVFLAIRRLTQNSCAGCIGSLVFILNPNVLYLQATPLTEPLCWLTFTASCYYLLAWIQEDEQRYLVFAAGSTFFATLARYDGWSVFSLLLVVIPLVGLLKHYPIRKMEGLVLQYGALGGLGILLWLVWNQVIFGDFLYFQRGPYSFQQHSDVAAAAPFFRHHLLTDITYYGMGAAETIGTVLTTLAIVGLILFLLRRRSMISTVAVLIFIVPFAFYVIAFFFGQASIFGPHTPFYLSGIIPSTINLVSTRYASEVVAPAAIFVGLLVPRGHQHFRIHISGIWIARIGLFLITITQSVWILYGGVISEMAPLHPPFCNTSYSISAYLSQHYDGGYILQTNAPFQLSESESSIHFSNVIYEGSGVVWRQALQDPAHSVDWVIMQPRDRVATAIAQNDPAFSSQFALVASESSGLSLYHKNGLPPLPTRPLSSYLAGEQQFCRAEASRHVVPRTDYGGTSLVNIPMAYSGGGRGDERVIPVI
jgi:cellulose synthase/poly-beta-1,6-N-acetylglucosamine synthase-like glycosyltransferase